MVIKLKDDSSFCIGQELGLNYVVEAFIRTTNNLCYIVRTITTKETKKEMKMRYFKYGGITFHFTDEAGLDWKHRLLPNQFYQTDAINSLIRSYECVAKSLTNEELELLETLWLHRGILCYNFQKVKFADKALYLDGVALKVKYRPFPYGRKINIYRGIRKQGTIELSFNFEQISLDNIKKIHIDLPIVERSIYRSYSDEYRLNGEDWLTVENMVTKMSTKIHETNVFIETGLKTFEKEFIDKYSHVLMLKEI